MAQQPPQQYSSQESISQQPGMQSQQSIPTHQGGIGQQGHSGQSQQIGSGQQYGQVGGQQGQTGLQAGQMGQQSGAGMNATLESGISDEMRVALHDFVQAANVCEWCAEQCIDEGSHMSECIRLCRDVADLATLNMQLLTRDSVFGAQVAEVFAEAAEACARECAQHPQKHCQECAEVLPRAARTTRKMLNSFGGLQGGQPQTTQFGPQASGQF